MPEREEALKLARDTIDGHDREDWANYPECVRCHRTMNADDPCAFCIGCMYLVADSMAETLLAEHERAERLEAELAEHREHMTKHWPARGSNLGDMTALEEARDERDAFGAECAKLMELLREACLIAAQHAEDNGDDKDVRRIARIRIEGGIADEG